MLYSPVDMLRTSKQQKKLCHSCPTAKTANLIGDSCILLIIRDLLTGPKHFGDLVTSLTGISTRTITNKLSLLEEKKIIHREEIHGRPPRVIYSLTDKGTELQAIIDAMSDYGKKYL